MWNFASNCIAGNVGLRNDAPRTARPVSECSDDETCSLVSRDDGLECPICYESFNLVENVPYVLWCGHTICKNCILGLQWAIVKFPTLPIQLPLFISCPWCNLMSLRLVYKGILKFPRKNYFLLWMVESMNGDRAKSHPSSCENHQPVWSSSTNTAIQNQRGHRRGHHVHNSEPYVQQNHTEVVNDYQRVNRAQFSLKTSLAFVVHLTAKFPLVIILLMIVLYAIPTSLAVLAICLLITVVFALPSFFILYFAYPSLDWLVREIIS